MLFMLFEKREGLFDKKLRGFAALREAIVVRQPIKKKFSAVRPIKNTMRNYDTAS